MKTATRIFLVCLITISTSLIALAQNQNTAASAYNTAKDKAFGNSKSLTFQGIGVAVQKFQDNGVTVEIAVGTSLDIVEVDTLTYTIQPISVTSENNNIVIKDIGNPAKLVSPKLERDSDDTQEIIMNPQMTLPITKDVNAVKLTISGLESDAKKVWTMILPVSSEIKTAGLVKIITDDELAENFSGRCSWFIGYCSGSY